MWSMYRIALTVAIVIAGVSSEAAAQDRRLAGQTLVDFQRMYSGTKPAIAAERYLAYRAKQRAQTARMAAMGQTREAGR